MSYHFLPYAQEQLYLMPPAITDWVAEGSLARFVSEMLEEMDREGTLAAVYEPYREDGWGSAAYHPLMMVKVLVDGYSVGMTSSRRLAQALEEQIAFRYLAANQSPDFRTIADFRKRHLTALEGLFVHVLRLCREAGLVTMGRVALDQNRTLAGIEREVHRLLQEAERVDRAEDQQDGPDRRGMSCRRRCAPARVDSSGCGRPSGDWRRRRAKRETPRRNGSAYGNSRKPRQVARRGAASRRRRRRSWTTRPRAT